MLARKAPAVVHVKVVQLDQDVWMIASLLQVPIHTYNASAFYGFLGEEPGAEKYEQADYTGMGQGIRCMNLTVRTGGKQ